MTERREHRYRVTFPDGRKITLVCRPDELAARLSGPVLILDETAVAEWLL